MFYMTIVVFYVAAGEPPYTVFLTVIKKDYQKRNKKIYIVLLLPVLGILQSSHNILQSSLETLIILGNNC